MSSYGKKVNTVFENFYKLFYESEDLALKRGIKCLTHTELHTIEAIGKDCITMNELSERLAITMGTATVAITNLEKKDLLQEPVLTLTEEKFMFLFQKKELRHLTITTIITK